MNNCCDNGPIPTTLPPSGPAGGDLSGTYPNPDVQWDKADPGSIPPRALDEGAIPQGTTITPGQVLGFTEAAAASLRTCAGAPHAANDTVPTCAEMNAAIDDAISALPVPSGISAVVVGCGLTGTGVIGDPIELEDREMWTDCNGVPLCAGPQSIATCDNLTNHQIPVNSPITGDGTPSAPLGIDCEALKTVCGIPGIGDIHAGPGIAVVPDGPHSVRVDNTAPFTGVAVNSPITGDGTPGSPLDIDCAALVNECGLLTQGNVVAGANVSVTPNAGGGVTISAAGGGSGGLPTPGTYIAGVTQVFDVVGAGGPGVTGVGSRANHTRIPDGIYSLSVPNNAATVTARVQVTTQPASSPAEGFFYANFAILNQGQPGSGLNPIPGASFTNGDNIFINEATGQMYLVFAHTTVLPNTEPDGTTSGGSGAP